jgi:acyl CoA:acetate/3-ketoacid CoA transferase alpha subunit
VIKKKKNVERKTFNKKAYVLVALLLEQVAFVDFLKADKWRFVDGLE